MRKSMKEPFDSVTNAIRKIKVKPPTPIVVGDRFSEGLRVGIERKKTVLPGEIANTFVDQLGSYLQTSRHTIPSELLRDFSFVGNGLSPSNKGKFIINGLMCAEFIKTVEFIGIASEKPKVTITGRLSLLDDERKKSWGIDL